MADAVMFQKSGNAVRPWRESDRIAWGDAIRHLGQGRTFKVTITHPRSSKDHAMFFRRIQKAFENNRSGIEFTDAEHLRAWCLVEAGYCATVTVPVDAAATLGAAGFADLLCELMHKARSAGHTFIEPDATGAVVKFPLSIRWSRLDQIAFAKVRDAVNEILVTRIVPGATLEQLDNAVLEDA